MDIALYVHIPFCTKKCHYCNFAVVTDASYKTTYLEALQKELLWWAEHIKDKNAQVVTIYFGGGTPSTLEEKELSNVLHTIHETFSTNLRSIEFEINPEHVTEDYIQMLTKYGITRISMGIQTLSSSGLSTAGRVHTSEQSMHAMNILEHHAQNWNVDLILGLPEKNKPQPYGTILGSVQHILSSYHPHHLSCYFLTIEPQTLFSRLPHSALLKDHQQLREHQEISNFLSSKGYIHYEISNWAKQGHESRHNLMYWRGAPFIGVGLGASTLLQGKSHQNCLNINAYITTPIPEAFEELSLVDQYNTYILESSRLEEGISQTYVEEHFPILFEHILPLFIQQEKEGNLSCKDLYWSIPERKRVLHNNIVINLFL